MSNARPALCRITMHTANGPIETDTEHLLTAGVAVDTDLSDPLVVMSFVTGRVQNFGHLAFTTENGIEAVLTHAILRIAVAAE